MTVELPDDLLIEAKATAARQRTTLRAIIEHALRREIFFNKQKKQASKDDCLAVSEQGLPYYKKSGRSIVTSDIVYKLMDGEEI